jgi:hypothetical protein
LFYKLRLFFNLFPERKFLGIPFTSLSGLMEIFNPYIESSAFQSGTQMPSKSFYRETPFFALLGTRHKAKGTILKA